MPLDRPVPALLDWVHWARVLAAAAQDREVVGDAAGLSAQAAGIEARLAHLAGEKNVPELDAPRAPCVAAADTSSAQSALDGLDGSVTLLAERLHVGALDGFALLP